MGTPDFAVPSLQMLANDYDVVAVYCQPPRPKGRGMRL
ncbi:MAG: methionyl-tRNA formyltransferase, partial [Proteobacteria bacterium]|nr:methionyl-tRNA formyltransferase [Pseudomonadota bacterium]